MRRRLSRPRGQAAAQREVQRKDAVGPDGGAAAPQVVAAQRKARGAGRLQRFYLSHPFTGDEEGNRAEAARIQRSLQERFPDVVFLNPLAMFAALSDMPYAQVMRLCLEVRLSWDAIVMAGRYSSSNGCMAEYAAALEAGLRVLFYVGVDDPLCSPEELRARMVSDGEEDAV